MRRWDHHVHGRALGTVAVAVVLALTALSGITALAPASPVEASHGTYSNPLDISSPVGPVENCADPTVTKARNANGAWRWWMYCTKDPRNDEDRQSGDPNAYEFQLIPIYSSKDLVSWRYRGNVFQPESAPGDNYPDWAHPDAGLFAPEIKRMNGQWYLYFSVTDVSDATSGEPGCGSDNAIGVATAPTPLGPWADSGDPVVDPRRGGGGCNFFWTIDPEVITVGAQRYMFWGSYYGGIHARRLSRAGLETNVASQVPIAIPNKFEGPEIVRRNGWFYLMMSATNCCNGPLTGYSVFAARSANILGPYVDDDGVQIYDSSVEKDPTTGRVGGSPVLSMNGNRFVGPGHNTVFRDFDGRYWTIYHAVDRTDPYFEDAVGFTKRPPLLDPIVWVDDWPQVRAGRWASARRMPAPAAQPGQRDHYRPLGPARVGPGALIPSRSDEFNGSTLSSRWSWVREPAASTYEVAGGRFRFDMQEADLHQDSNNASVLVEDAPSGEWLVEARVRHTVPAEGCCPNFSQAGLVIYGGDDEYVKLVHVSIWETRQTEWAKEVPANTPASGYPRYGNTIVGPPGEWTIIRIVKTIEGGAERYQAWTRRLPDGDWVRGGVWEHDLGADPRIGLVSMGEPGPDEYTAYFDWVRVYRLHERRPVPTGDF